MKFHKRFRFMAAVLAVMVVFSCNDDDPVPPANEDNLVEASATGARSAEELRYLIGLSGRNIDPAAIAYDVDVYNVVYNTQYKDATIQASGLVLLPKTTGPVPMLGYQHGTIVLKADAPSVQSKNSLEVVSYAALASMGFITAVPDYIGFGASREVFHPYYVEETTAQAVTDLLRAAATLAEQKGVTFDNRLFLAGYSQGGYATLAAHKSLEEKPMEGFSLVASFSGAGGYNISAMQEYLLKLDHYKDPYYLAYVGMSYRSYYDQASLLENFFNPPYAERIPALFDGTTPPADIDAQLTEQIPLLVRVDILNNNPGNEANAFLREKFLENSLTDWSPALPLYLYHGDADGTVPVVNSQLTWQALINNGADESRTHLTIFPGKDHGTAVEPFIEDVITQLQAMR